MLGVNNYRLPDVEKENPQVEQNTGQPETEDRAVDVDTLFFQKRGGDMGEIRQNRPQDQRRENTEQPAGKFWLAAIAHHHGIIKAGHGEHKKVLQVILKILGGRVTGKKPAEDHGNHGRARTVDRHLHTDIEKRGKQGAAQIAADKGKNHGNRRPGNRVGGNAHRRKYPESVRRRHGGKKDNAPPQRFGAVEAVKQHPPCRDTHNGTGNFPLYLRRILVHPDINVTVSAEFVKKNAALGNTPSLTLQTSLVWIRKPALFGLANLPCLTLQTCLV